ncbi:MAG TPA: TlpA disulfide reductase family protein [Euzebyales bacterium]|nr:TlpA disulfide reductase family protein [Euzebyales bacterium]
MVYLAAAVAVVGALCLLDLVLTFGVIRRLREHTRMLATVPQGMTNPLGIAVGEAPGEFSATTTSGETVSRAQLSGPTLVGFFAPGCEPCATELPRFVERAGDMPGGQQQALAIVIDGADDESGYRERLEPVARVVVERHDGPLQAAFRVAAYPTIYLLGHDGVVLANGTMMSDVGNAPASDVAAV